MNISLNYGLRVEPPVLEDDGDFNMVLDGFTFQTYVSPYWDTTGDEKKIALQINSTDVTLNPLDVLIQLDNTNDFNNMLVSIINTIKLPIINVITKAMQDYLQQITNFILKAIPSPFPLFSGIKVDMSNLDLPTIREGVADSVLNGTFFVDGMPLIDPEYKPTPIPRYLPEGQAVQVFISEYSVQTLLWSMFQADLLQIKIDKSPTKLIKLDTTTLGFMLPGLPKKFGKDRPCTLYFEGMTPPSVEITNSGIDVDGFTKMTIFSRMKNSDVDVHAVTLKLKTRFIGTIAISEKLVVSGGIDKMELEVVEVLETDIGKINEQVFNLLMGVVKSLLEIVINTALKVGINIPSLFKPLAALTLTQPKLEFKEDYIQIQAFKAFDGLASSLLQGFEEPVLTSEQVEEMFLQPLSFWKQSIKEAIADEAKDMTEQEKKAYLSHSTMKPVKTAYKAYKFMEASMNMNNPDYAIDPAIDDL